MALHACTQPNKPVASTAGPRSAPLQANTRRIVGFRWASVTSRRSPSRHSGCWALGSRPTFFLVGHAALLRGATAAPQSAGHSAPRFGHISSIGSQVSTSIRTAVRLSTSDLSCTFFVPAPPCSLTHLALPRSSSSAPTSLGGQQGCLCAASSTVCLHCVRPFWIEAQLSALQAFAQISLQLSPRTARHRPAPHGNMAARAPHCKHCCKASAPTASRPSETSERNASYS